MKSYDKKKIFTVIALHLLVAAVVALWAFLIGCPIRRIFNVPCPGCGLSRAYLSLLNLDFKAAFSYHPLFAFVPFALFFGIHRNVFDFHMSKKVQNIILIIFVALFIAVYLVRLFVLHDSF